MRRVRGAEARELPASDGPPHTPSLPSASTDTARPHAPLPSRARGESYAPLSLLRRHAAAVSSPAQLRGSARPRQARRRTSFGTQAAGLYASGDPGHRRRARSGGGAFAPRGQRSDAIEREAPRHLAPLAGLEKGPSARGPPLQKGSTAQRAALCACCAAGEAPLEAAVPALPAAPPPRPHAPLALSPDEEYAAPLVGCAVPPS